jgi:CDP-paratose synthetase
MQKKIILSGATGFLGSHLLESFISQGFDVHILTRSTSNTRRIDHLNIKFKRHNLDETNLNLIFETVKPDFTVHTACCYGRNNENLSDILNSNLTLGLELLEASIANNVKSFINSDTFLPRDLNEYSLSKSQLRDWLKFYHESIRIVNLKIEFMYGYGDNDKNFLIWLIKRIMEDGNSINLTSGKQKRDFIHVSDVVSAFNICIQKNDLLHSWNEFHVGTNIHTELKEIVITLAESLQTKTGKDIKCRLNFGSVPYRKNENMTLQLDNSELVGIGWKPIVGIKEGVEKLLIDFI